MTIRFVLFGNGVNRRRALASVRNQTVRVSQVIFTETLESYRDDSTSGWTVFLDDNDTIREDYVELLTTKYAGYDTVIPRMTDGKVVFPPIGTSSPGNDQNYTITDEIIYYIGGVTVPRSLTDLIIQTAKRGELATFYSLVRPGISLLSMSEAYLMNPCVDFWE